MRDVLLLSVKHFTFRLIYLAHGWAWVVIDNTLVFLT